MANHERVTPARSSNTPLALTGQVYRAKKGMSKLFVSIVVVLAFSFVSASARSFSPPAFTGAELSARADSPVSRQRHSEFKRALVQYGIVFVKHVGLDKDLLFEVMRGSLACGNETAEAQARPNLHSTVRRAA